MYIIICKCIIYTNFENLSYDNKCGHEREERTPQIVTRQQSILNTQ